jgi:hypothetical protein
MCPTFKQARRRTQSRSLGRPARLIKVNRMRNIDPLDGKAMRGLLRCCAARARCGDFSAAGKTGRSQNQNQRHHDAEADFLAAGGKQELTPSIEKPCSKVRKNSITNVTARTPMTAPLRLPIPPTTSIAKVTKVISR